MFRQGAKHRLVRAYAAQHSERLRCLSEGGVDVIGGSVLPGTFSREVLARFQAAAACRVVAFDDAGSVGAHCSDRDTLKLVEADLVFVEAGGAGALVIGHLLRHLELAAVPPVLRLRPPPPPSFWIVVMSRRTSRFKSWNCLSRLLDSS